MNLKIVYVVLSNENRQIKKNSPKRLKKSWKQDYQKRRETMERRVGKIMTRKGYQYSQSNTVLREAYYQQQRRLVIYFGNIPVFRKLGRMDKIHRKYELGLYASRKYPLVTIFQQINNKAVQYAKREAMNLLKQLNKNITPVLKQASDSSASFTQQNTSQSDEE